MKNKITVIFATIICLNYSIIAEGLNNQATPVGWIDCREVHGSDGDFSIYTSLGVVPIKVLDYDEEGGRFLVECIKYGNDYYPVPDTSLE